MKKITLEPQAKYKGHSVITGDIKAYQFNPSHLDNNLKLMEAYSQRHNKVYSWRMDLRLPDGKQHENPKGFISSFMNSYTNNLSRKHLDPEYAVKMEQQSSENPHFHCQILADGNKTKDYRSHIEKAESILAAQLDIPMEKVKGLIDCCNGEKNGIMIRRNSPAFQDQFDECYKQMSYLAKEKSDDVIPSDVRKVFYSRYNKKKARNAD